MALVMTPIYTQTASGSAQTITFNNIPQFYTDLKLVLSMRTSNANTHDYVQMRFNGVNTGTLYSDTRLEANGSTAFATRDTNTNEMYFAFSAAGATATANTFSSAEVYIPNYTSSNFKQAVMDYANENNTAGITYIGLTSGLFRSTNAIQSMSITSGNGIFTANSTFSLYGIIRSGA